MKLPKFPIITALWMLLCLSLSLVTGVVDSLAAESGPPPVRCLKFSPDGRLLAASTADMFTRGELVVWDTKTYEPRWRHSESVGFPRLAFSPDGTVLALSRFAPETMLFDVASGKLIRQLKGHTDHARSVTFTPNGRQIITGSYDRTIKIWDAASGRLEATLEGHTSPVYHVDVTSDGRLLASADKATYAVYLWDLPGRKQLHVFGNLSSLVPQVSFSPDGKLLAVASWGGHVTLFDTKTYKTHLRIRNIGGARWAEFSPDGRWLAVVNNGKKIYVFSVQAAASAETQQRITALLARFKDDSYQVRQQAHKELSALGAAAEPQLRAARTSSSPEVRWRARQLRRRLARPDSAVQLTGHKAELECVSFSPDSKLLVSGDRDGQIKVWRTADWTLLKSLAIPIAAPAGP